MLLSGLNCALIIIYILSSFYIFPIKDDFQEYPSVLNLMCMLKQHQEKPAPLGFLAVTSGQKRSAPPSGKDCSLIGLTAGSDCGSGCYRSSFLLLIGEIPARNHLEITTSSWFVFLLQAWR